MRAGWRNERGTEKGAERSEVRSAYGERRDAGGDAPFPSLGEPWGMWLPAAFQPRPARSAGAPQPFPTIGKIFSNHWKNGEGFPTIGNFFPIIGKTARCRWAAGLRKDGRPARFLGSVGCLGGDPRGWKPHPPGGGRRGGPADQAFRARMISGTTWKRSPTMPMSATPKMGASGSLLMAMMVSDEFIPTRCWICPDTPQAM